MLPRTKSHAVKPLITMPTRATAMTGPVATGCGAVRRPIDSPDNDAERREAQHSIGERGENRGAAETVGVADRRFAP